MKQLHFANCAAHAAVLFTTLIENLKLCSSAVCWSWECS